MQIDKTFNSPNAFLLYILNKVNNTKIIHIIFPLKLKLKKIKKGKHFDFRRGQYAVS